MSFDLIVIFVSIYILAFLKKAVSLAMNNTAKSLPYNSTKLYR